VRYAYQPSFLATTRNLSRAEATKLLKAVEKFQAAMEHQQWPKGLGITHLRGAYFEFRVDIHTRVMYRRSRGLIQYILYGNHDDVRRFLKTR
jgi:hypothetical protein